MVFSLSPLQAYRYFAADEVLDEGLGVDGNGLLFEWLVILAHFSAALEILCTGPSLHWVKSALGHFVPGQFCTRSFLYRTVFTLASAGICADNEE
jgi:hypothetical protein